MSFDSGIMHVTVPLSRFWANIDRIAGNDRYECQITDVLSLTCTPEGFLPLNVRRTWRDAQPAIAAVMKKINAALGLELQLEVDPYSFYSGLQANKECVSDAVPRYLEGLA